MNRLLRPDGGGRDAYIRETSLDVRGSSGPTMSRQATKPMLHHQWQGSLRGPPPPTNHFLSRGGHKLAHPRRDIGGNVFVSKARLNPVTGEATVSTTAGPSVRIVQLARPSSNHARARTARALKEESAKGFSIADFVGHGPEYYLEEIGADVSPIVVPSPEPSDQTNTVTERSHYSGKNVFEQKNPRRLKLGHKHDARKASKVARASSPPRRNEPSFTKLWTNAHTANENQQPNIPHEKEHPRKTNPAVMTKSVKQQKKSALQESIYNLQRELNGEQSEQPLRPSAQSQ